MNPEDLMRELRDPANWKAKPTIRTDVFPARRRWSPLVVSLATVAAVAVVLVVVFSAVGGSVRGLRQPAVPPVPPVPTVPTVSETPTVAPTSSPSPTPTAPATLASSQLAPGAEPPALFGGDCSSIMTAAEVSAFEGATMTVAAQAPIVNTYSALDTFAIHQAGGLECQWIRAGSQDSTDNEVYLVFLPESTVKPLAKEITCGAGYSEGLYGPGVCTIEHVTNGIRVSGGVETKSGNAAKAQALSKDVLALIDKRAAAVPSPSAPITVASTWANPVDCVALDKKIDADALFGGSYAVDASAHGENGPSRAVFDLLNESQSLSCSWYPKKGADYVGINVQGGGAWAEPAVAALKGSTKIDVEGTDAAYVVRSDASNFTLHVFSGVNWLDLHGASKDFSARYAAVKALIAALDGKKSTGSSSAADTAVITTAGWGDLKLGNPVPASTKLVTWKTIDPDKCFGHPGYWDLPNDPGAVEVRTVGNTRTGDIQLITLLDPSVKTKSGAHVGMSLADLKRLFPNAKVSSDGRLYSVADSLGQVVFDVGSQNADGNDSAPAAKDVVRFIHVLPTSMKPFSNQNTEFGSCA